MSQKEISRGKEFFSCENYLPYKDIDSLKKFLEIASRLKIHLLVVDGLAIKDRDLLLNSSDLEKFSLINLKLIYETVRAKAITFDEVRDSLKSIIYSEDYSSNIIVTRKTIHENSIDKIKKQLGSIRNQYEIIALHSNDRNTLKWAAQDRRIDYITIELHENSEFIDQTLCSVVKQNNKNFEIVLSSIINTQTERELSDMLRKGKKLMRTINSTNAPFIYTMKPKSYFDLRTGSQMRHLGSLLDSPYNETKTCVFDKQIETLTTNIMKLHESHVFEGIREV